MTQRRAFQTSEVVGTTPGGLIGTPQRLFEAIGSGRKAGFTEDKDGNVSEVRILTDHFVPIIRASCHAANRGRVLTISSSANTQPEPETPAPVPANHATAALFEPKATKPRPISCTAGSRYHQPPQLESGVRCIGYDNRAGWVDQGHRPMHPHAYRWHNG